MVRYPTSDLSPLRQKRPFLDTGRIVREVKVASEPESLLQVLENPIYGLKRIGHPGQMTQFD